jgi:hypothetical protein
MDCGHYGLVGVPGEPPLFDRSGAVIVGIVWTHVPLRKLTPAATTAGRAAGSENQLPMAATC